jgi:uncharacterized membrane protein (UPF0136 family)
MMSTPELVAYTYGGLVALGGVFGWLKAKSKPSLIMGLVFGLAVMACGFAYGHGKVPARGVALVLSLVLLLVFVIRYIKTRKLVPAGVMMALSLVAAILFLFVK